MTRITHRGSNRAQVSGHSDPHITPASLLDLCLLHPGGSVSGTPTAHSEPLGPDSLVSLPQRRCLGPASRPSCPLFFSVENRPSALGTAPSDKPRNIHPPAASEEPPSPPLQRGTPRSPE